MTNRTVYSTSQIVLEKQREHYISDEESYGLGFAKTLFFKYRISFRQLVLG